MTIENARTEDSHDLVLVRTLDAPRDKVPSTSPDGSTLAVTMREAAIEVVVLGTGSTGGNSDGGS